MFVDLKIVRFDTTVTTTCSSASTSSLLRSSLPHSSFLYYQRLSAHQQTSKPPLRHNVVVLFERLSTDDKFIPGLRVTNRVATQYLDRGTLNGFLIKIIYWYFVPGLRVVTQYLECGRWICLKITIHSGWSVRSRFLYFWVTEWLITTKWRFMSFGTHRGCVVHHLPPPTVCRFCKSVIEPLVSFFIYLKL